MSLTGKHADTIDEAIARLISRAENARALEIADLRPRVQAAVEKYLFRGDAGASSGDVSSFIDDLRADDLCLILACEKGDGSAWEELVASFDPTVKSAARKISTGGDDAEDLAS